MHCLVRLCTTDVGDKSPNVVLIAINFTAFILILNIELLLISRKKQKKTKIKNNTTNENILFQNQNIVSN